MQKSDSFTISKIIETHFPNSAFLLSIQKQAGKKLEAYLTKEKLDEQTAINEIVAFLQTKTSYNKNSAPNFQPPAKALIIAQSRSFDQWDVVKASNNIQSFIYNLPSDQIEKLPDTSKSSIEVWIKENQLDLGDFELNVQIINKIIPHAKNTYLGVISKVENKNNKIKHKTESLNKWRKENDYDLIAISPLEMAIDPNTKKLIHPPGINSNIYCCQQMKIIACQNVNKLPNIPPVYSTYTRDPNESIFMYYSDRFNIPQGQSGHVPQWQRDEGLVKKKPRARRRSYFSHQNLKTKPNRASSKYSAQDIEQAKSQNALLCKIQVQNDWVIFDARGLLRNLYWRNLMPSEGLSLNQILQKFTGDPVIDTKRNVITFCYKEGIIPVHSVNITKTKKAPELLTKLTQNQSIGLISVDLGQTNPISVKFSRISQQNGKLISEHLNRQFLPQNLLQEIQAFRQKSDQVRENIYQQASALLSPEYQQELNLLHQNNTPTKALGRLTNFLNINLDNLPWNEMSSNTFHIANTCQEAGVDFSIFMSNCNKKSKKNDFGFAKQFKTKVSEEARIALNEKIWELQRQSLEYDKLSKRKQEWARKCVNYLIDQCKNLSNCKDIVFVIENLNIKIFAGSGKREKGWDNFFLPKKENRWVIQHLHKALSEITQNKGINVIEVSPQYTSQTCTQCDFVDKANRQGEGFECQKCYYKGHADLEIATDNLEKVALSGKGMVKPLQPKGESSSAEKKAGRARNSKKTKKNKSLTDERAASNIMTQCENDASNGNLSQTIC